MKLHDSVALLIDLPEKSLVRGQVGTIVEEWAPGVYEVEFADGEGVAYAMEALSADKLMPLVHRPMRQAS